MIVQNDDRNHLNPGLGNLGKEHVKMVSSEEALCLLRVLGKDDCIFSSVRKEGY